MFLDIPNPKFGVAELLRRLGLGRLIPLLVQNLLRETHLLLLLSALHRPRPLVPLPLLQKLYMDNVERGKDKPAFEVTDNSIAHVGNPTNSPRKVWVRNNGDPRNYSRFNKESRLNNSSNNNYNDSAADEEARKYATSTSSRIVDYIERIYQV